MRAAEVLIRIAISKLEGRQVARIVIVTASETIVERVDLTPDGHAWYR